MLTLFDRKGDLSFMNEIDKGFDQVAAIIENARATMRVFTHYLILTKRGESCEKKHSQSRSNCKRTVGV